MISRLGAIFVALSLVLASSASAQGDSQAALPLTIKSKKTLHLLNRAWDLGIDQVEQVRAIEVLRKVVKVDPNFALGHEILAQISLDPVEQMSEQRKAFAAQTRASAAEQSIVAWFENASDHRLIPAIRNMNDVLRQYPRDRWVVYLANHWLTAQTQYERAAQVFEQSGLSDSPGLMNDTAYTYAYMREFDKAFALMDKYVAALPRNANPQDSYAEILRLAGQFDQALEHYRAALAINPNFYSSQFGIADTYSLMGDQLRARLEYEEGFRKFQLPALHEIQWKTRVATTYVREGDLKDADDAFQAVADYAHSKSLSVMEADTYRQKAMYQPESSQALFYLNEADGALHQGRNAMPAAVQQESAQILRARVELAVRMADAKLADKILAQLAELSNRSDDKLIETAYHGAAGAVMISRHEYQGAIIELEEDIDNPLSLKLLALAYESAGDVAGNKHTQEILANMKTPTLEQALVVPSFRKCLQNPSCDKSLKTVSLKSGLKP
jgi:tetratricopeptide (TPR) repeat protein